MNKAQHKEYMENILKELGKTITITAPLTSKKEDIPVTSEEEFLDLQMMEALSGFFGTSTSPLQRWIEDGKGLLAKEINETKDYLEDKYEKLLLLNDEIMDEEERLENLKILLDTVSL